MLLLPCAIKSSWFFPGFFPPQPNPTPRAKQGLGLLQLSGTGRGEES